MKQIVILFFISFHLTILAQSTKINGDYEVKYETQYGNIKYQLFLHEDGTFLFHSYENNSKLTPNEKNSYGKGTWKANKNIVTFFADEQDLDTKHTLNFSNSKARFSTKSPRDKTDRAIKTALKFLDSDIFWIKGIDVYKVVAK